MNAITSQIKYLKIKRPFSRKIRLRTDHVLTDSGRDEFLADFELLSDGFPLVASLVVLAYAFQGDYAKCDALTRDLVKRGFAAELSEFYENSDLRKFLLDCFRDYFEKNDGMPRSLAHALFKLSYFSDDEFQKIFHAPSAGRMTPDPIRFDYAGKKPRTLTIRIFCRTRFFGETSRPHDIGLRLETAFDGDGIDCKVVDPTAPDAEIDRCDLALVDDVYTHRKDANKRRQFLERLRAKAAMIGMLEFDPWAPGVHKRISANRDLYDFVWSMAPSMVQGGEISGLPVSLIPFPVGCGELFDRMRIDAGDGSLDTLKFCGGIEEYNLHRYFWVLAGSLFPTPFQFHVTNHKDDGLSAQASLGRYLDRLSSAYASLSFTMRIDGKRIVVGRTFDSLRLGQLLVQEYCEDMHCYFAPGAHYLEFRDALELEKICQELSRDGEFERIRAEGTAYFSEFYSDDAVLRHLCTFL